MKRLLLLAAAAKVIDYIKRVAMAYCRRTLHRESSGRLSLITENCYEDIFHVKQTFVSNRY